MKQVATTAAAAACLLKLASAQSSSAACSSTLSANYPAPSVAEGYSARLVANKLTSPRGIAFDSAGNLLVVEAEKGITALTFNDGGNGCVTESARKTVIADTSLNHGIQINGSTLFASSSEAAYRWAYDAGMMSNTSMPTTLVQHMAGEDHTTRTMLVSKSAPGMLVICRGSVSNIDAEASDIMSGHSQIKAYDLNALQEGQTYDYVQNGTLLGWGLRNEVGIDEHPDGGIWGVENSVDQMMRDGKDIHETNPAEELNFLGYLNGTQSANQGRNFGYPQCFTAWNVSDIPNFNGQVGQQFAIGDQNATVNDTTCDAANRQAPRLAFFPHTAPLDILFNEAGTAAWITFHGSWNRDDPAGYYLGVVEFANGEPTQPSNSTTALSTILANQDNSKCPDGCFRPVGLAWDSMGRLFMSSDESGEIYVIERTDGSSTSSAGSNATGTIPQQPTPAAGGATETTSQGAASIIEKGAGSAALAMGAVVMGLMLW